jgi:hypothetical protein
VAMETTKETNSTTPRPFYKWKSFCLGILVLGCLAWAWVRSSTHADFLSWKSGGDLSLGVGQVDGSVYIWRDNWEALVPVGFDAGSNPAPERTWFSDSAFSYSGGRMKLLTVAHWLVAFLFVVPWVGWLFWRVGKQRI